MNSTTNVVSSTSDKNRQVRVIVHSDVLHTHLSGVAGKRDLVVEDSKLSSFLIGRFKTIVKAQGNSGLVVADGAVRLGRLEGFVPRFTSPAYDEVFLVRFVIRRLHYVERITSRGRAAHNVHAVVSGSWFAHSSHVGGRNGGFPSSFRFHSHPRNVGPRTFHPGNYGH